MSSVLVLAAGLFAVAGASASPRARPPELYGSSVAGFPVSSVAQHAGATQLGTVRFDTSCAGEVQPGFARAVALLHSFEFGAAIAAFETVARQDPACAIAWWGIALARWGNPFAAGLRPAAPLKQGAAAIDRGRMIGAKTERERDYLAAAAALFDRFDSVDQRTRVIAYRDAMRAVAAKYPDDSEASTFYALALAAAADPADKTYAAQLEAGAILERLWKAQPDHPGLAHYIIHAYDVPSLAPRAIDAARRYGQIAPAASHALHMPSHTFTRLGYWQDSIDTNILSAAAARRDGWTAEELHATDYQVYAYLQTAQDAAARRLVESLPEVIARFDPNAPGGAAPPTAGFYAIAAIPARYALERGAWAEAARLEPRPHWPPADAMTWFARALGAARSGDPATARAAIGELEKLASRLSQGGEAYWAEQVAIQHLGARAWVALAEGNEAQALEQMRAAAEREDKTEKSAITPGPLAPARELLGDMLLERNYPQKALEEYEKTMAKEPNRYRALAGAATAAARAGHAAKARKYYEQLLAICEKADSPGRPELTAARSAGRGGR